MKKLLLMASAALLAGSMALQAETLSPAQALARLNAQDSRMAARAKSEMKLMHTFKDNVAETPVGYVFSSPAEKGFMILSADDVAVPLLGYSDDENFDPENIPDGLQYMLDCYAHEIADANLRVGEVKPLAVSRPTRKAIEPLCTTKWDQDAPFNLLCPKVGTKATYAGCVAIGMAQVVKYHEWPAGNGYGTASYSWSSKTLSFNFSSNRFDWTNMKDTYESGKGTTADASCNAVATLVYACGVGAQMNYGTSSSAAVASRGLDAMKTYMGYYEGARMAKRALYDLIEWEDLMYEQLAYGPLFYNGYNQSYDGNIGQGHCFVVDGYKSNGYFHVNWGWAGMADGYYLLSALDPENQGSGGSTSGYNFNQEVPLDLVPDTGQPVDTFYGIYLDSDFEIATASASLGSRIYFAPKAWSNSSANMASVLPGLRFQDANGKSTIATNANGAYGNLKPNYGWTGTTTFSVTLPTSLAAGTYTVHPGFKDPKGVWHDFQVARNYVGYSVMTITGTTARFNVPTKEFPSVSEPELQSEVFSGRFFEAGFDVTNPGSEEYYGSLVPVLCNSAGNIVAIAEYIPVSILPGEKRTIKYLSKFKSIANGNYTLVIAAVWNGSYYAVSEGTPVVVKSAPTASFAYKTTTPVYEAYIEDGVGIYKTDVTVTCTAGIDDIYMGMTFFDGSASIKAFTQFDIPMSAGRSRDFHFEISIPGVKINHNYKAGYYIYRNNSWSNYNMTVFQFQPEAGVEIVEEDSLEVISIETYDLAGRKIETPDSDLNPTGIDGLPAGQYIRVITHSDGSRNTLKIAVP